MGIDKEIRSSDIYDLITSVTVLSNEVCMDAKALRDHFRGASTFSCTSNESGTKGIPDGYYNSLDNDLRRIQDNLFEIRRAIEATR